MAFKKKPKDTVTLGDIIREARMYSCRLTRREAADLLGIAYMYMAKLENNDPAHISDDLRDRLKNVLGVYLPDNLVKLQNDRTREYLKAARKRLNRSKVRESSP